MKRRVLNMVSNVHPSHARIQTTCRWLREIPIVSNFVDARFCGVEKSGGIQRGAEIKTMNGEKNVARLRSKTSLSVRYNRARVLLRRALGESSSKRDRLDSLASSPSVSEPATTSSGEKVTILKSGWVKKQGQHKNWTPMHGGFGVKPWEKRFLTVSSDGKIAWRSDERQKDPNRTIHITNYRVCDPSYYLSSDGKRQRDYGVKISLVPNDITQRDLNLRVQSVNVANSWIEAIVKSIGVPKYAQNTDDYRYLCSIHHVKTQTDAVKAIRPLYETIKEKSNDGMVPKQIGVGGFAQVYHVRRKSDGVEMACKRVHMMPSDHGLTHLNEVSIMRRMDHPHIVRVMECFITDKEASGRNVAFLFMEYCSGGTVMERLRKERGGIFKTADAVRVSRQLLSALGYMHSKGFVHRDVKLENVLFRNSSPSSSIVLVDFGISRPFHDSRRLMTAKVGSPWYLAPEQIKGQYDEKIDVWASGVCVYWMLTGHPPFGWREAARVERDFGNRGDSDKIAMMQGRAITDAIVNAKKAPPVVSLEGVRAQPQARAFVQSLLTPKPNNRPNALVALGHAWLHDVSSHKVVFPKHFKMTLCKLLHRDFLKTASLIIIAHTIERSALKQAYELYAAVDSDGNGRLSKNEWVNMLRNNGLPRSIALRSFDTMDFDGNGTIRVSEFVAAMMDEDKLVDESTIRSAFCAIDIDNKGYITVSDVSKLFGYVESDMITTSTDRSKNDDERRISMKEFKEIMSGKGDTSIISAPVKSWQCAVRKQDSRAIPASFDSSSVSRPLSSSSSLRTALSMKALQSAGVDVA